jgi:hypothetical protein
MKKKCSLCKQAKNISQFASNASKNDGLQSMCKVCQKTYGHERYQENKAYFYERNRQNRRAKRRAIEEYKVGKSCADCGNPNPIVLTFDHRKGVKKVAAVSDMANRSFTLAAIYEEIAKCDLRCFNCHMIKDNQKRSPLQVI